MINDDLLASAASPVQRRKKRLLHERREMLTVNKWCALTNPRIRQKIVTGTKVRHDLIWNISVTTLNKHSTSIPARAKYAFATVAPYHSLKYVPVTILSLTLSPNEASKQPSQAMPAWANNTILSSKARANPILTSARVSLESRFPCAVLIGRGRRCSSRKMG